MKPKTTFLVLIAALLLAACSKSDTSTTATTPTTPNTPTTLNETKLVELVNNYRRAGCNCGSETMPPVPVITWNDTLERAAQLHSDDMRTKNYFSHTGSDSSLPWDRVLKYGYNYAACGENIAQGYANEEAVIKGWIESPGHCKNIMSGNFKEMGVAASGSYWTQVFATRR